MISESAPRSASQGGRPSARRRDGAGGPPAGRVGRGELPALPSHSHMRGATPDPDDFANDFQAAFARLQIRVETACAAEPAWPERVAAAIRAALAFAAAHPDDAGLLTNDAMAAGREGIER